MSSAPHPAVRGEKRANPDDPGSAPGPSSKKAKEKIAGFDWSTNNFELTWKLVNELCKPENHQVLFPDDSLPSTAVFDSKETVYRRIAKAVTPEAFAHDAQIAGSRMKNKTVSMWKDYSIQARKLQGVCRATQYVLPPTGPGPDAPVDVIEIWKSTLTFMPVFPVLRPFMPVRPEEKPRIPRASNTVEREIEPSTLEPGDDGVHTENTLEPDTSISSNRSIAVPSSNQVSLTPSIATIATERPSTPSLLPSQLSFAEYLSLRHSYQEDVRLGIFSAAEAKTKLEVLDRQRSHLDAKKRVHEAPSCKPEPQVVASPAPSTSSHSRPPPQGHPPPTTPADEAVYQDRLLRLGFWRPSPSHPASAMSWKHLYQSILHHAADCELHECRIDPGCKVPRFSFRDPAPGQDPRAAPELVLVTPLGAAPVVFHLPIACKQILARPTQTVLGIELLLDTGDAQPVTFWDRAYALFHASLHRRLNVSEVQALQRMPGTSGAPFGHAQPARGTEHLTLYSFLRNGVLLDFNSWEVTGIPGSGLPSAAASS